MSRLELDNLLSSFVADAEAVDHTLVPSDLREQVLAELARAEQAERKMLNESLIYRAMAKARRRR